MSKNTIYSCDRDSSGSTRLQPMGYERI